MSFLKELLKLYLAYAKWLTPLLVLVILGLLYKFFIG